MEQENIVSALGRNWEIYPEADSKVHGLVASGTAGVYLPFGTLVYLATNGSYYKADVSDSSEMPAVAIAAETIAGTGDTGLFLLSGIIRNDNWSLTVGDPVYASGIGDISSSSPIGYVQIIGYAVGASVIRFQPSLATTFASP